MSAEIIKIDNNTEIEVTSHKNGEVRSKVPYVSGMRHGLDIGRWNNGQKEWERMWVEGKKHGMNTYWWENGGKWSESMRRHGKEHGVEICLSRLRVMLGLVRLMRLVALLFWRSVYVI